MSADMKFFYRTTRRATWSDGYRDHVRAEEVRYRAKRRYSAYPDQLPIRRVVVQWGDGLASYDPGTEATNSFPNRRGQKDNEVAGVADDSACDGTSFGTTDDACIERPFSMTHTYTCGGSGSLPVCTGAGGTRPGSSQEAATGCYDGSFTGPSGQSGACVYIPRVHIKDNWGFCTGRCPNTGAYVTRADAEKCFDGNGLTTPASDARNTNECATTSTNLTPPDNAWTYFQGRVIVGPP